VKVLGAMPMTAAPTAKDRFSSVDTLALVRELRGLERARVDKAFDLTAGGWSLALRVPSAGRRELVLVPGKYAALLPERSGHSEELSSVARELRRVLTGALLRSVSEPGGERFLELTFSRGPEGSELRLALELFGTGNLVVADGERIVVVAHPRQWAHRTVRVGSAYARPPRRSDPWTLGIDELASELARSRTDLTSTLAARLALGGPVAEELIARGGWAGSEPAATIPRRIADRLHLEMQRLLSEVGERPTGFLYLLGEVAVDATPYASHRWKETPDVTEARRPSFSEAASEYFGSLAGPAISPEERAATEARREIERQIERQRRAVSELAGAVSDRKREAEAIFAHFAQAEAALAEIERGESTERTIEVTLGDVRVPLLRGRSLRESSQALYEAAKRLQSKLEGAEAALRASEDRLTVPPPRSVASSPAAPVRGHREHWFERYRWFVSSEGVIVVGGRDAGSNDTLVRRHLKDGDVYVHADLHGAASVIVKHPPPGAPDPTALTFREAGQWAVAYSKAWRAGLASASAFWVTPDQVSKSGASGEFVARGAWVIHGTKNVLDDLPTELGIGTVDYEGSSLWTVAPPAAVRARGALRFLLTPGPERERADREKELSRDLGLARTRLQSLLPAGGLTVRRP
jgi:predicted ribosome quality control (RQC) complex YloA/Tae2 family protein